ncbi:MAG: 16S rRNA (cytosine(1402)-N(4))-methyltransferase RsmH [Saprospiraceae bacterium]|nr:16S rRNA (cytosine(1402)-N(4))-methyltransferase RsmH [Saprospiraceae bacterium]
MTYHVPAMVQEVLDGLKIKPEGIYVDVTFGGGGHSKAILQKLNAKGRLIAFDQDENAFQNQIQDDRFLLIQSNFRYLKRYLKFYEVTGIDGLLADLGVSSHQLDKPERGFAFKHQDINLPLDMRMNLQQSRTAADVLNQTKASRLETIFKEYGEIWNAAKLVKAIEQYKARSPILTIGQLVTVASAMAIGPVHQYLAKTFQALRIEVNDELLVLEQLLEDSVELLNPGGRLVVISYHSLEDRLVKRIIQAGNVKGITRQDSFGNKINKLVAISKKTIQPSEEEIKENYRVRSARLRIAEKLA